MSLIKSWNQVEAHKSKTGEFPSTPGADHDLYLTWIKQCDARKAHALVLSQTDKSSQNRLNELLKIRALLFRGQLSQRMPKFKTYKNLIQIRNFKEKRFWNKLALLHFKEIGAWRILSRKLRWVRETLKP